MFFDVEQNENENENACESKDCKNAAIAIDAANNRICFTCMEELIYYNEATEDEFEYIDGK